MNLEATGPGGKDTSSATVIVIGPELPVAAFSASPTSGLAPLTVTFTNRSTDATSYVWDFGDGDGSTSSAATVEHTYEQADSYKVTLSATGPGGTAAATETIAVVNPDLPVAAFRASPVDGALPLVVRFDNGYPLVDGQKDRSQPKIFTDRVEYAWGGDSRWAAFESCLALNKAGKEKIKKEWL